MPSHLGGRVYSLFNRTDIDKPLPVAWLTFTDIDIDIDVHKLPKNASSPQWACSRFLNMTDIDIDINKPLRVAKKCHLASVGVFSHS